MSANIDMSNGQANVAFLGSRKDVWHHLGQEMLPGMSIEEWRDAAGLGFKVLKTPAFTMFNGEYVRIPKFVHLTRNDTGKSLGYVSEKGFKVVQPGDILHWFEKYILVDSRFQLDAAGSLQDGGRVWATAKYVEPLTVAGEDHTPYLLMTTGFDGTLATWNQGSVVRTICNNTLMASLADKRAQIRTKHSQHFNPKRVAEELATIAQSFDTYKAMGEAMATTQLSAKYLDEFLKEVVGIQEGVEEEEVSTRKRNQLDQLYSAYHATVAEGTEANTVWTALNAVTRYTDHDRSTHNTEQNAIKSRLSSAQFGSGNTLKTKAWNLLAPLVADKVAVAA